MSARRAGSATRYLLLAAVLVECLFGTPRVALAFSCSATSPGTQSFGNVNPVSGLPYSTTGTIAVTCSVGLLEGLTTGTSIRACLNIGGASGSTPRTLTNGTNTLQYNLYSDSAHTQIIGSASSAPPNPIPVDFNLGLLGILLGGTATQNVSIYAYLPAGQTTAPAGSYNQTFSGSNASIYYTSYVGTAPTCSTAWTSGGSFGFSVTANVTNTCNISATNMSFGSAGLLTAALSGSALITAQCTMNDSYSIALNAGMTAGASLSDRQMIIAGGSSVVHYQLYTSASNTLIWGDGTSGTGTLGGVANGANQTYTVYGRVPVQTTPAPGAYSDTVTATITY